MATACCADCGQVCGKFSWFEANGAVSLLCPPCHNYALWAYQDKLDAEAARDEEFVEECERLAVERAVEEDYYFNDPGDQEDDFVAEEQEVEVEEDAGEE
jgi:hypothetical protein